MAKAPWRPTRCTPEVTEIICEHIARGCPQRVAAQAAGVCRRSYLSWIERGEKAYELASKGEELPEREEPFLRFLHHVEIAESACEAKLAGVLEEAAVRGFEESYTTKDGEVHSRFRRDWRAAAWLLERKHKNRWSQHATIEQTVEQAAPLEVVVEQRPPSPPEPTPEPTNGNGNGKH